MAKSSSSVPNEVLLLDTRLLQRKTDTYPDLSNDEYFLISSVDTLLRPRGLSSRQIEDGIVEGTNDGGVDAVYVFIDGHLVEDVSDIVAGEAPRIELEIIQAKNESGFKETFVQTLLDHLPLLLQLDRDGTTLDVEFNPRVLERFETFRATYLAAADKLPDLTITVRYATKSAEVPHDKVEAKVTRLKAKLNKDFPNAKIVVDLVGAADLNARARERKSATLKLRVSEGPISPEKGGLICLISLADYFDFITDDEHRLRDGIFEENVRDFEGLTVINRGIADSLRQGDDATADFWWLNNGVTVVAKRLQPSGKRLDIEDPQIVNGLQTSRSVFQYFHTLIRQGADIGSSDEGKIRQLLVRIIETQDEAVAAQVIKATNSQNRVSAANLRSAEPFQRSIEEYFQKHGLFYERKKNHYKNLGKPRAEIVEVLELAQAVGSIILHQPNTARGMPSALVRGKLYEKVFSSNTPLEAYYKCLQIVRIVDKYLADAGGVGGRHERSNTRYHLARAATSFALVSSRPRANAVAKLDISAFDDTFLRVAHEWVITAREAAAKTVGTSDTSVLAKSAEWVNEIDRRMSRYTQKGRWPKKLISPRRV
ncbi:AIPR family protein [Lentzea sp. BCCO 10_0856]|uniref:AIPR family protein n=1 Tax=Lentzea miocenica TaxID=3095431 RepID=A0ABU4T465_9PSEU|nr:AIPR family protein [Lentzea sp. BCCO 10_0856]MDX8032957.1 AIPR family protein [Lentzea sp. BCCO 10_0856]